MDIVRTAAPAKKARRLVVMGALGAGVVVMGVAGLWRSSASAAAAAPVADRSSAWIETVRRGDLVREVAVQGALVPEHVQWLTAMSPARVARRNVKPGTVVEPETVIVTLENPELTLAALEADRAATSAEAAMVTVDARATADAKLAESAIIGLEADLRDAKQHVVIADRLFDEKLLSDNDRTDAINKVTGLSDRLNSEASRRGVLESGRSHQVAAQRAEVDRLLQISAFRHQQVDALNVRAGIHGVVQEIPLEDGQWVAVGGLLGKVAEPDRLKADVHVAEGNAKDVHKGLPVRFESGNGPFRGTIERVDPSVVGGSVRLEVLFDGPLPAGARADQTVTGYVELETVAQVLHVARPAGAQELGASTLFRLDADGTHATRVPVRFGKSSARDIEIASGLAAGDQVLVSDTSAWESASRVRLK